uniref:Rho-GAP domain-containing protein n=1 Tax=Poecilia reticulata TaxID=8081 RepID=A0A3P9P7C3_POERE
RETSIVPKFVEKCIKTVERREYSWLEVVPLTLWFCVPAEEHLDLEDGQWEEIHVITGALKLFFRELPEPLFPFCCFDKFIAAIRYQRVSYTKDLVRSLPLPNYETMKLLFKHLRRVIDHKDSNRMSVQSVAIVFGPTLLRPQIESANMTVHMVFQSQIVELMLNKFNEIFAET